MDNAALRHAEESMEKPLPQKLSLLYSPGGLRGAVRQLFLSIEYKEQKERSGSRILLSMWIRRPLFCRSFVHTGALARG